MFGLARKVSSGRAVGCVPTTIVNKSGYDCLSAVRQSKSDEMLPVLVSSTMISGEKSFSLTKTSLRSSPSAGASRSLTAKPWAL